MTTRHHASFVAAMVLGASLLARVAVAAPPPRTIKCESNKGRHTYCRTGVRGPVRLERQLSGTPCRQYDTWGADDDGSGIWVREGCRAVFVVGWDWGPPGNWGGGGGGRTIDCKSEGFQYAECPLRHRGRVRLVRKLSDTRCVRGDNWDTNRRGIWVDRGCAGRFVVE